MNLEKWYKWSNVVALALAAFCLGGAVYANLPLTYPIIIMVAPTTILLVVVVALLAWSFFLTRK